MLQGGGGVDPRLTPAEVLCLFSAFHVPGRDPAELLDLVGLRNAAGTRFRRLSGGERQRLALAIALVGHPEVVLLDEPTAGMDPAARAATRALVRSLCDEGAAVLLTTHDLGDVERIADRVVILDRGRIVVDGPPAVVAGVGTAALRVRFAEPVQVDRLAAGLSAVGDRLRVERAVGDPFGVTIHGAPPDPRLVAALATWADAEGVLVTELHTTGGSLEERYLELTGDRDVERSA
jgi:ABC-2 type transport system ATP-binding protein